MLRHRPGKPAASTATEQTVMQLHTAYVPCALSNEHAPFLHWPFHFCVFSECSGRIWLANLGSWRVALLRGSKLTSLCCVNLANPCQTGKGGCLGQAHMFVPLKYLLCGICKTEKMFTRETWKSNSNSWNPHCSEVFVQLTFTQVRVHCSRSL